VPTFLRDRVLEDTIQQVLDQAMPGDEILIVDQTPQHDERTQQFLEEHNRIGEIRWIHERRASLTHARNVALELASTEIVVFLDDDVILPSGYLDVHRRHHDGAFFDLISGPVFEPEVRGNPVETPDDGPGQVVDTACKIDIRGSNHSVNVKAARQVGGYDEKLVGPAHYEENDFARRLFKAGGRILHVPECRLVHLKAPSGGCRISNPQWREWQRSFNILVFAFRHATELPEFCKLAWAALRAGPFRKVNVVQPWRQIPAWLSFCRAVFGAVVCGGKVLNTAKNPSGISGIVPFSEHFRF